MRITQLGRRSVFVDSTLDDEDRAGLGAFPIPFDRPHPPSIPLAGFHLHVWRPLCLFLTGRDRRTDFLGTGGVLDLKYILRGGMMPVTDVISDQGDFSGCFQAAV